MNPSWRFCRTWASTARRIAAERLMPGSTRISSLTRSSSIAIVVLIPFKYISSYPFRLISITGGASGLVMPRPGRVIVLGAGRHPCDRRTTPRVIAIEIVQQLLQNVSPEAAEMNVGGLLPHQLQQVWREHEPLVAGIPGHLDLCDIGRELSDQPFVMHLKVRVWNTDRVLQQCRSLRRHMGLLRPPIERRGYEGFGLTCVALAVLELLDCRKAPPTEAAQASRRPLLEKRQRSAGPKRGAEHVLEPLRKVTGLNAGVVSRIELLFPELRRGFLGPTRQRCQRCMPAIRNEDRVATRAKSGPVSFEQ